MDLQRDGNWKAIHWPLPRGEVRDVPKDAKVHHSVIKRMQEDAQYRPGNLIMLGVGGRGRRVAPKSMGMGEWVSICDANDPVSEIFVSKAYAEELGPGAAGLRERMADWLSKGMNLTSNIKGKAADGSKA